MNDILARWNSLPFEEAAKKILHCCGATAWAQAMASRRPLRDAAALLAACDEVCKNLRESDWLEAFRSHPRIGESGGPLGASYQSAAWSRAEQQKVGGADEQLKAALAEGNRAYEQRFKRIFIVCATGKSVQGILEILRRRLQNDDQAELRASAEEQRQIAHIRLRKWLSP